MSLGTTAILSRKSKLVFKEVIYAGGKLITVEHSSTLTNLHQERKSLSRLLLTTEPIED